MGRVGELSKMVYNEGNASFRPFVPNPLPFQINMDDNLQSLLSKADLALGRLDGKAENLPDKDYFIFTYIRKEATNSSQVEGTQATFTDVLKAEANILEEEEKKDVDEIINYISAMNFGLDELKKLPLSTRLIKEIHVKLLSGVRGHNKAPGEFRRTQNWIGGPTIETAKYIPPPTQLVLDLMSNFEKALNDNNWNLPTLLKAGLMHAQFESIHPFLDGNGRIGRLLITFYLCEQKTLKYPLLYLSAFFRKYRQNYYDKLNDFHNKDDIESWLKFFLQGVYETAEAAVVTSRKILTLKEEDTKKIIDSFKSSNTALRLLNSLYTYPYVKTDRVMEITKLAKPNAINLTKRFEELGILEEMTGKERNKVYKYTNYLTVFEEPEVS